MLLSALFSGNIITIVVTAIAAAFLVFVCIPVHELAHGFAAYKLGDKSVKATGQLSLNPIAHIDPIGAVLIATIGFGWGKPCHVNSRYFKDEKRDLALVAISGPLSNILLGWLFIFILVLLENVASGFMGMVAGQMVAIFLDTTATISIWLGVLNLLPIPMFDGFTVLRAFLSNETEYKIMSNMGTINIIIIVLLFTGILTKPISWISTFILSFLWFLSSLPFGG